MLKRQFVTKVSQKPVALFYNLLILQPQFFIFMRSQSGIETLFQ